MYSLLDMLLFYLAAPFYTKNVFVQNTILQINSLISFSYVALLSKVAFKQILSNPVC